MTSEELMQRLDDGEDVLEELYRKNRRLILGIARKAAASFHALEYDSGTGRLTGYSRQILEELTQEGAAEFFRLLRAGGYDVSRGKLSTYVYPYLWGVMVRWMRANPVIPSLEELIPEELGEAGETPNPLEFLGPKEDESVPVDFAVYRKICLEHLRELFLSLPEKDREILGSSMGVFGYRRKTLDEIALTEMLTVDGVIKARDAAIRKIKERCPGSKLELWRAVHSLVNRAALLGH